MKLIRATVGLPEPTKFIILIPPIAVAKLLQYSGSRVEHRDGFSSHKMICSDSKMMNFHFGFKAWLKTVG